MATDEEVLYLELNTIKEYRNTVRYCMSRKSRSGMETVHSPLLV